MEVAAVIPAELPPSGATDQPGSTPQPVDPCKRVFPSSNAVVNYVYQYEDQYSGATGLSPDDVATVRFYVLLHLPYVARATSRHVLFTMYCMRKFLRVLYLTWVDRRYGTIFSGLS